MNDLEFKSLWTKVIDKKILDSDKISHTYKPNDMTFSNDITVFPTHQTFSEQNTLVIKNIDQTFSGEKTVGAQTDETFSNEKTTALCLESPDINFQKNDQDIQQVDAQTDVISQAWQNKLKRKVSIKKIPSTSHNNKVLTEAQVTAYLEHPNILPIHNIEENAQGQTLLVMKLLEGYSWSQLLHPQTEEQKNKSKQYNLSAHIRILTKVCNAVRYAHSKGIVHCDLKPENVLIGNYGEVLVIGWGIAVSVDNDVKKVSILYKDSICEPMGTPCYMPPELAEGRGKDISTTTDIYLLGAILYEILHKSAPRKNKNLWNTLLEAQSGTLPKFDGKNPQNLINTCQRAMAKHTHLRYQTVDEFQMEIESFLSNQESVVISDEAKSNLDNCLERMKNLNSEIVKTKKKSFFTKRQEKQKEKLKAHLYDMFIESIFGFKNASEIWQENVEAIQGEITARLEYANFAFQNADTNLALSQLEKLDELDTTQKNKEEISELYEKIARDKRDVYSKINHHTHGVLSVTISIIGACILFVVFFHAFIFFSKWIPSPVFEVSIFIAIIITLIKVASIKKR
ncbi:serine/threonine protein kinase [Candidatus Uabimicrobium amorphum]|uniref:Serine/threonine protein kinase n=1 Tax=Uabimicrobium amorphum TaxID=2596890 RepID=A0A5S9IT56_UABAM|nr:serine/threonine-protein kinase [Candidatus Uabimicrobium amorphum]BBM86175.1 serine/threonine protein kinase [Candidatus Uabimicrobium amorphum]